MGVVGPSELQQGEESAVDFEKREVPAPLQALLAADVYITSKFCDFVAFFLPLRAFHSIYKALQMSCHDFPCVVGWSAFIWIWNSTSMYQMHVNLLIGPILNALVLAVVKALTQRRRPTSYKNDMITLPSEIFDSPDEFSFPSSNATRACFIAHFFNSTYPISTVIRFLLIIWAASVCVSCVLLHRHHVLDAVAGAFIGILESYAVSYLWFSQDTCWWLLSAISVGIWCWLFVFLCFSLIVLLNPAAFVIEIFRAAFNGSCQGTRGRVSPQFS